MVLNAVMMRAAHAVSRGTRSDNQEGLFTSALPPPIEEGRLPASSRQCPDESVFILGVAC